MDSDCILLKFMFHRGTFREVINEKCILCKNAEYGIKYVINKCEIKGVLFFTLRYLFYLS